MREAVHVWRPGIFDKSLYLLLDILKVTGNEMV